MDLRVDALFEDEFEPAFADPAPCAAWLGGDADTAHPEDAILSKFVRWLAARGASAAECSAGIELACDALDQLGDVDAPWQALNVGRWLGAAHERARACADAAACTRVSDRAREFLACLVDAGRLSLHGQRVLLRKLAALRPEPSAVPAASLRPLAA